MCLLIATAVAVAGLVGASGAASALRVLGQPDFTGASALGVSAGTMAAPSSVALDKSVTPNRLYVADSADNRVLGWSDAAAVTNGQPADLVIGQPGFESSSPNAGGISAQSLSFPSAVAVDATGNLYVADLGNNRVLEYDRPFETDTIADRVFGQRGSFGLGACNSGGSPTAETLCAPEGLALDDAGNLYVGDTANNRVLEYKTPLRATSAPGSGDTAADTVFGQNGLFTTASCNSLLPHPDANSLCLPVGIAIDSADKVYVSDAGNNRVLDYQTSRSRGIGNASVAADAVLGQEGNFMARRCNPSGVSANSLCAPLSLAVDSAGRLYVADSGNNRVLEYGVPAAKPGAAQVFGQQGSFASKVPNNGGVSAASLKSPSGVAVDSSGNVYVADRGNNRVLEFRKETADLAATSATPTPTPVSIGVGLGPTFVFFPSQLEGTTSPPQTVTLANFQTKPLNVFAVTVTPSSTAPIFPEHNDCLSKSPLPPRGKCTISVAFAPPTAGGQSATLSVSDDSSSSPQTATLAGIGVSPNPTPTPGIGFSPITITITAPVGTVYDLNQVVDADYTCTNADQSVTACSGNVPNGSPVNTSSTGLQEFTVTATDSHGDRASLSVSYEVVDVTPPTITINSPGPGSYAINQAVTASYSCSDPDDAVTSCAGPVASGSPVDTSSIGPKDFTVRSSDSHGNSSAQTVDYHVVPASTGSLTFGPQFLKTLSGPESVRIKNPMRSRMILSRILAEGDFQESNNCPGSLARGTSCLITVRFSPNAVGNRFGTLAVLGRGADFGIDLSGIGTLVRLSRGRVSFPRRRIGTTSPAQKLTLANRQSKSLGISAIALSGDFSETDDCGNALAAKSSCTISVSFKPAGGGDLYGTLVINADAPVAPPAVTLTGFGVNPAASSPAAR